MNETIFENLPMVDIIKKRVWSDGRQLFAPVSTELQKTKNIYHNPNHQQTLTFYQNSRMILKEM